jgi:hypothetical protein
VASRYLANYSGWQRVLDDGNATATTHWLQLAVAPNEGQ